VPRQQAKSRRSNLSSEIKGLLADGPFPGLEQKLELFGQFVGDWDIVESRYPRPEGTVWRKGEVHFRWVLEGRAVQDVWMTYDEKARKPVPAGTTIRFYDPTIDAWHSIWISPFQRLVRTFVARKVGEEIRIEGKTGEGLPERWIFSDITPDSFTWHSEETRDGGKTWLLTEEMKIRRQRRTDTPAGH
jgi:hypothetical protein